MKTLAFILVVSACVTVVLSVADYKPRYPRPGMAHAASPRSSYKRPDQHSSAFVAEEEDPYLEELQECANQECEQSK